MNADYGKTKHAFKLGNTKRLTPRQSCLPNAKTKNIENTKILRRAADILYPCATLGI